MSDRPFSNIAIGYEAPLDHGWSGECNVKIGPTQSGSYLANRYPYEAVSGSCIGMPRQSWEQPSPPPSHPQPPKLVRCEYCGQSHLQGTTRCDCCGGGLDG